MHGVRERRTTLDRLAVIALALGGCAADMPPLDGQGGDTFSWDVAPPADRGPAGDAPETSDARPADAPVTSDARPADRGSADGDGPAPCAEWSAWTCELDPVLLCRASCAAGPLQLSCINAGSCVCGVSTGPCGNFSSSEPCDVCRQAVEAGCCNP